MNINEEFEKNKEKIKKAIHESYDFIPTTQTAMDIFRNAMNLKIQLNFLDELEKQEECEYCQLGKPLIIRNDESVDLLTIVSIKENNLKLTIEGEGITEEEINYCPKCGRKLKGEE